MRTTLPTHLTDTELLSEVKHFAQCEREATSQLVAHLAELDSRRLYLAAGYSSLFTYCCEVLCLSESEAYNRIEAARAARRFPAILSRLASASLNLTTVRLLAPHLTDENHEQLLSAATGLTKRQVEEMLARTHPRPDVPATIRKLPITLRVARAARDLDPGESPQSAAGTLTGSADAASDALGLVPQASKSPFEAVSVVAPPPAHPVAAGPTPPSACEPSPQPLGAAPPRRATLTPLAADRYQIKFTASGQTCQKLRRAQDLLRHVLPTGDPAEIFDRALSALIAELTRRKMAAVKEPARPARKTASGSRHIAAQVKRAVWARDEGRCAFIAAAGRRCGERGHLEFHHVRPYAAGGTPRSKTSNFAAVPTTITRRGSSIRPCEWTTSRPVRRFAGDKLPTAQLVPERVRTGSRPVGWASPDPTEAGGPRGRAGGGSGG